MPKALDMRRTSIISLVLLATSLFPLSPVDAGPVQQIRIAFGEWEGKRFDRDHWVWLGALVFEKTSAGEAPHIVGGVFKGTCERKRRDNGVSISCHGHGGRGSKIESFVMDPVANEATLDVRDRRFRHHVEWTATAEVPFPFQSGSACQEGEGHGGGIVRPAIAEGHVFGRHYRTEPSFRFWNELWVGGEVTQCGLFSQRDMADVLDGGSFTLHRRWFIPSKSARLAI